MSVGVPKKRRAPEAAGAPDPNDVAQTEEVPSSPVMKKPMLPPPPPKKAKSRAVGERETEETKDMSTSDLQRLVLLEQLKLIRMQQAQIENGSKSYQ